MLILHQTNILIKRARHFEWLSNIDSSALNEYNKGDKSLVFEREGGWSNTALMSLADKFGVSTVAAFRRLHDLSIITDQQYHDMYKEINAAFKDNIKAIEAARVGKDIPFFFHVRYINSHGHLLPRTIVTAQNTGIITLGTGTLHGVSLIGQG